MTRTVSLISDPALKRFRWSPIGSRTEAASFVLPLLLLLLALTITGCATFEPRPIDEVPFMERAQTQVQDNLTVTVALPAREEATQIYGVDPAKKAMQPVWIEVKNDRDHPVWFLPSGLDPSYPFSSSTSTSSRAKQPTALRPSWWTLRSRATSPWSISTRCTNTGSDT